MMQDPEDELLDQSLRETFSDFDLPPARHVWAGIEGRLGAAPKASSGWAVPLKVLLPVVGLVGAGVGWLLPHTETPPAAAPPARQEQVRPLPDRPAPAATPAPAPEAAPPAMPPAAPAPPRAVVDRPGTATIAAAEPAAAPVAAVAAPKVVAFQPVPLPDSLPAAVAALPGPEAAAPTAPAPPDPAPADAAAAEARTDKAGRSAAKAENQREHRTEYRVPSHRMAEKGRGIRRRFARLGQRLRHLLSPRRSKAAAQPGF